MTNTQSPRVGEQDAKHAEVSPKRGGVASSALYNEIDGYASRWIGNLIAAGHVAPGVVDTRSIVELNPEDVRYAQAHFFAGIAVWSAALRSAGWPDDCPIWTGSCPCQPFSQAGRGKGVVDERHLWPEWFRLIRECRPAIVVGEQVASPAGLGWLDAVFADLEGAGYACAAADLCAASVGAPHIRQRLYFVAIANSLEGRLHLSQRLSRRADAQAERCGEASDMADADDCGFGSDQHDVSARKSDLARRSAACAVADNESTRRQERRDPRGGDGSGSLDDRASCVMAYASEPRSGRDTGAVPSAQGKGEGERIATRRVTNELELAGATRVVADAECNDGPGRIAQPHGRSPIESDRFGTAGFWSPADWIPCSDGKARPVEPGTFPLAHGALARVGRLRAYGNAIVRPQAQAFIESVMDMLSMRRAA